MTDRKGIFTNEVLCVFKQEEKIKRFGMTREARGKHVDFPSMESALITISLLLFAVYLIKLVMVSLKVALLNILSTRSLNPISFFARKFCKAFKQRKVKCK